MGTSVFDWLKTLLLINIPWLRNDTRPLTRDSQDRNRFSNSSFAFENILSRETIERNLPSGTSSLCGSEPIVGNCFLFYEKRDAR